MPKLREQRAKLVEEAREIYDSINSDMPEGEAKEKEARFDELMEKADDLLAKIEREEKLEAAEKETREAIDRGVDRGESRSRLEDKEDEKRSEEDQKKFESRAFDKWLRGGMQFLNQEERGVMLGLQEEIDPKLMAEVRAQGTTPDTAGGYTVPEEFMRELEIALKAYGGMRQISRIVTTTTGANMPWPTSNDTNQKGEIIAENTQHNEQDVVYGSAPLGSFTYSSKIIRVSVQLIQDSAFDIQAHLTSSLGERIGRITNEHFTTGTGTGQPRGVLTDAVEVDAAALAAIAVEDLIELKHGVDPAYRVGPNVGYMFNDTTLKELKKLKDGENRPLWKAGVAAGEPDTIDGDPYIINQDMPDRAANSNPIAYGNWNKYIIRDVLGIQLIRMVERYADFLQVGFLAFSRHDGRLIDAGTNPIKKLKMPAT